jgi:hypothetical protein
MTPAQLKTYEELKPFFDYLYNLSVISIAFVGFAALFLGFRQAMARKSTKLDAVITRNHFGLSFMVVGGSLLPPLLVLASLPVDKSFQWASAITGAPLLIFCITYPARRYKASRLPMPTGTKVLVAFFCLAATLLLINVVVREPALYVVALTLQQFINVITFMYALRFTLDT